jgi:hypothetical protein
MKRTIATSRGDDDQNESRGVKKLKRAFWPTAYEVNLIADTDFSAGYCVRGDCWTPHDVARFRLGQ